MKFDKRHLIVSLTLLIGSIAYNVWVFTKPAARPAGAAPAAQVDPLTGAVTPAAVGGTAPAAQVNPTEIPAPPDVALDQLPQWPRDPFTNTLRSLPDQQVATTSTPAPAPEPDPTVASILYSPQRRLAMINGRAIGVGDTVGDAKVIDIQPRAVVVESASRGRRTLELKNPQQTITSPAAPAAPPTPPAPPAALLPPPLTPAR